MSHVTTFTPNVINDDVFNDTQYKDFYKSECSTIHSDIKDILKQDFNGYTIEYISQTLHKNPAYINQIMSIWNQHYLSFFKNHGRIIFNSKNNHWIYIPKRHPQANVSGLCFEELTFYRM